MLPKLNGVKVPHRKNTAAMPAVAMPTPKTVTIPMNMHIGAPSKPCVNVGDMVKLRSQSNFLISYKVVSDGLDK